MLSTLGVMMQHSASDPDGTRARAACVELMAVPGMAEIEPGHDLAGIIARCAGAAAIELADGDIVVVAQKIVSKAEGAYVDLAAVTPGTEAVRLAGVTEKDPRLVEAILADTSEVLRARPGILIVADRHGHVMANAGVDASNLPPAAGERVLRLPRDADASATALREAFRRLLGISVAVVINDSWGRAWRNGTIGHAIGAAGFPALWDRRGEPDMYGRTLRVTEIGLADEIAAAASLVMGAAAERQPVVIVRGYPLPKGDGKARDLVRDKSKDLFR